MSGLRSGQVARAAGGTSRRYYERRGLLAEPGRTLGGHQLYPAEAVVVLRVIKAAQRLGFSLDEVAELLQAGRHRHHAGPAAGLRGRVAAKLAEAEAKIADLTVIAGTLRAALETGCEHLIECAGLPHCPLPFAGLAGDVRDAGTD